MHDLTKEERAVAASQNWGLFHVFDLAKQRWSMNVLPLSFEGGKSAEHALRFVLDKARNNQPVAIKALQLIAQFNSKKGKR